MPRIGKKSPVTARLADLLDDDERAQAELARLLNKSRSAISEWKAGRAEPDLQTFARLCQVLRVSADDVLGLRPTGPARAEVVRLAVLLGVASEMLTDYTEGAEEQEDIAAATDTVLRILSGKVKSRQGADKAGG